MLFDSAVFPTWASPLPHIVSTLFYIQSCVCDKQLMLPPAPVVCFVIVTKCTNQHQVFLQYFRNNINVSSLMIVPGAVCSISLSDNADNLCVVYQYSVGSPQIMPSRCRVSTYHDDYILPSKPFCSRWIHPPCCNKPNSLPFVSRLFSCHWQTGLQ